MSDQERDDILSLASEALRVKITAKPLRCLILSYAGLDFVIPA
jgi:hypothetical protein